MTRLPFWPGKPLPEDLPTADDVAGLENLPRPPRRREDYLPGAIDWTRALPATIRHPRHPYIDAAANIRAQRDIARRLHVLRDEHAPDRQISDLADELAELVLALDEHRLAGGPDPYRPVRSNHPTLDTQVSDVVGFTPG